MDKKSPTEAGLKVFLPTAYSLIVIRLKIRIMFHISNIVKKITTQCGKP